MDKVRELTNERIRDTDGECYISIEKNEKLGPYLKKNCIDCEVIINDSKR